MRFQGVGHQTVPLTTSMYAARTIGRMKHPTNQLHETRDEEAHLAGKA